MDSSIWYGYGWKSCMSISHSICAVRKLKTTKMDQFYCWRFEFLSVLVHAKLLKLKFAHMDSRCNIWVCADAFSYIYVYVRYRCLYNPLKIKWHPSFYFKYPFLVNMFSLNWIYAQNWSKAPFHICIWFKHFSNVQTHKSSFVLCLLKLTSIVDMRRYTKFEGGHEEG